jgi:RimJ/RimL family protein N-acetyltransferase
VLHPAYPLRTERLLLRPFDASDFDAVYAIQSREDVVRWLYEEPLDAAETRAALERNMQRTAIRGEGEGLNLAIVPVAVGQVVGNASLFLRSETHRQGEVGFVVHPDYQGRGYATEAAARMLELAFDDLRLHRVIGRTEARNTPSASVLERLGFRREAHLIENEWVKGEWQSELVYALLEREWRERRRAGGDRCAPPA